LAGSAAWFHFDWHITDAGQAWLAANITDP
jgi:hypothetical protein